MRTFYRGHSVHRLRIGDVKIAKMLYRVLTQNYNGFLRVFKELPVFCRISELQLYITTTSLKKFIKRPNLIWLCLLTVYSTCIGLLAKAANSLKGIEPQT